MVRDNSNVTINNFELSNSLMAGKSKIFNLNTIVLTGNIYLTIN